MAFEKVSFKNCIIFALALAEVTSWTIDLPEVRRFYFEKNAKESKHEVHVDYTHTNEGEKRVYYNNIEGNSKHNTRHYGDTDDHSTYATEYGYQTYMEKKVNSIVYHGSVYLEGLRRALEDFSNFLETCNRTTSNQTLQNGTLPLSVTLNSSDDTISESFISRCREATKRSEHVRRLSALAMWATRELQDIAYARKYHKGDYLELAKEENELILKLAWFLDRLASYTGYEPEPKDFLEETERTTTTTLPPPPMIMNPPPSEEQKRMMMECLKQDSLVPAVDRCRYPGALPPLVELLLNMNNNTTPSTTGLPAPSNVAMNPSLVVPIASESRTSPISEQSMELLIASDNRTPRSRLPPILTAVSSVRKRSVLSMPPEAEHVRSKRSIEDPAINFLKYYAKHKVWESSNPKKPTTKSYEELDVNNNLPTHRQRRAVDKKFQHFRLPEDPFQDLSNYVKHRPGVNYVKDTAQTEKLRQALKKIDKISKPEIRKLAKLFRQKRYVKYENDVDKPRQSVDPQGDISYYVKNKAGRNYNYNPVQAAQVRAGLEAIFNNPNIEVVRRYGANYNPAIPDPFLFGLMRTLADF